MNKQTILIAIGNSAWTLEALHQACKLARQTGAEIALVKMAAVQHLSWLSTSFGDVPLTSKENAEIEEYKATLEDYGIPYQVVKFQYATLTDALEQAACYVNAQIVFAALPQSIIPGWQRFQYWRLRERLASRETTLFNLAHGEAEPHPDDTFSMQHPEELPHPRII
jgi:hypothetical protein